MADQKKPKKTKTPIADVQQPGTTAPSETSRPVIVGNRPLLRDPMVTPSTDEAEPKPAVDQPETTLASSQKVAIQPLEASVEQESDTDSSESAPAEPPSVAAEPESADPAPAETTSPPDFTQAEPPATEPASNDPVPADSDQTADTPERTAPKQAEVEAAAQAKHQAEIQEMVDSKRYVLPINAVEQRKSQRFVVIGAVLAVILTLIWLDIALDAGIIKLSGLKPLTHFFSN